MHFKFYVAGQCNSTLYGFITLCQRYQYIPRTFFDVSNHHCRYNNIICMQVTFRYNKISLLKHVRLIAPTLKSHKLFFFSLGISTIMFVKQYHNVRYETIPTELFIECNRSPLFVIFFSFWTFVALHFCVDEMKTEERINSSTGWI